MRSYNAGKECVVGFGSSAIDYLALVAKYPKPDEKLRTEELEVGHLVGLSLCIASYFLNGVPQFQDVEVHVKGVNRDSNP